MYEGVQDDFLNTLNHKMFTQVLLGHFVSHLGHGQYL